MNFTGQTVKNQKIAEKERVKNLLLEAKRKEKETKKIVAAAAKKAKRNKGERWGGVKPPLSLSYLKHPFNISHRENDFLLLLCEES